jgi:hypothetical protein
VRALDLLLFSLVPPAQDFIPFPTAISRPNYLTLLLLILILFKLEELLCLLLVVFLSMILVMSVYARVRFHTSKALRKEEFT